MLRRLGILLTCLVTAGGLAGSACAAGGHGTSRASRNVVTRTTWHAAAHPHHVCVPRVAKRGRKAVRCASHGKSQAAKRILARAAAKRKHQKTAKPARVSSGSSWSSFSSHVETWALDDCGEGSTTPASLVRAWASYVETNCGPGGVAKALTDCHSGGSVFCSVIQYLDTNWIFQQGSPPYSQFSQAASESWYQHLPGSGARVQTGSYGGGYLINQSNAGAQSFFQGYVRSHYDSADGLMLDDQSSGLSIQLYYSTCGCKATAENPTDQTLRASHTSMSAAMTHSDGQSFVQINNTLPANPYLPQGLDMLNKGGVHGLLKEGSPEYNGHLDPYYSTLLDEISYVANETSSFVVPLSYGQAGASTQQQSRRVQAATILLGYSPGHLVSWTDLNQGSNDLSVWPEQGIYPTQPVQSMGTPGGSGCLAGTGSVCSSGGHNDLQVAPGVYRREFAACYDRGTAIGPCASIVNTTSAPVTVASSWLTNSYAHQVTFNGTDVQAGGTISTTNAAFTPGSTTVGIHDATLLSR